MINNIQMMILIIYHTILYISYYRLIIEKFIIFIIEK